MYHIRAMLAKFNREEKATQIQEQHRQRWQIKEKLLAFVEFLFANRQKEAKFFDTNAELKAT